jgi:heat-inducible transcriptional repressor
LSPVRLLVVVIADTGSVDQRLVELVSPLSEEAVSEIKLRINAACTDVAFDAVGVATSSIVDQVGPETAAAAEAVVAALVDAVGPRRDDRVLLAGTANLARAGEDFGSALEPVLAALEEQMVLLRLLGEETGSGPDLRAVSVRIGTENEVSGLTGASVVTTGYGSAERVVAHLGVVGPTRMDYAATMGAVHAVARYLGRIIGDRI